jgi:hypothetical protein
VQAYGQEWKETESREEATRNRGKKAEGEVARRRRVSVQLLTFLGRWGAPFHKIDPKTKKGKDEKKILKLKFFSNTNVLKFHEITFPLAFGRVDPHGDCFYHDFLLKDLMEELVELFVKFLDKTLETAKTVEKPKKAHKRKGSKGKSKDTV